MVTGKGSAANRFAIPTSGPKSSMTMEILERRGEISEEGTPGRGAGLFMAIGGKSRRPGDSSECALRDEELSAFFSDCSAGRSPDFSTLELGSGA